MSDPTPQHPESPLAAALIRLADHAESTRTRVDEVDKKQSGRLVGVGGVVGVLVVLVPLVAPYLQPDKAAVAEVVRAEVKAALEHHREERERRDRRVQDELEALTREVKAARVDAQDSLARCVAAQRARPVEPSGAP